MQVKLQTTGLIELRVNENVFTIKASRPNYFNLIDNVSGRIIKEFPIDTSFNTIILFCV